MVVFWEATTSRSLCNSDSIICITGFCANFFSAVFVELSPVCSVCTVGVETFARVVVVGTGELDAVSVVGKEEVGAGGGGGGVGGIGRCNDGWLETSKKCWNDFISFFVVVVHRTNFLPALHLI